jgi:hypothetical protein
VGSAGSESQCTRGLSKKRLSTRTAAERGYGLGERATSLCDKGALLSGLAILDGAHLPTEHGHAALPSGQPAHIRVISWSKIRTFSAAPSKESQE